MVKPVILGCRQESFSESELVYFNKNQPLGLILFKEACISPEQIKALIQSFRKTVSRDDAPILIDNEGGKVMRMRPPHWRDVPAPRVFADLYAKDKKVALRACYLNARLIAHDMQALGLTVNCAPLLDIMRDDTFHHEDKNSNHATSAALKDRAFGSESDAVIALGRAYADGLMDGGVTPVMKHIPGYGRVKADPHFTVTEVDETLDVLEKTDFTPFKKLNDLPAAMTGHVVYKNIDPVKSSTVSKKVIDLIRAEIGFKGVLFTDTVEMNSIWPEGYSKTEKDKFGMGLPLQGTLARVSKDALAAGCDVVLHSATSLDFNHAIEIMNAVDDLSAEKQKHIMSYLKPKAMKDKLDAKATSEELKTLLG